MAKKISKVVYNGTTLMDLTADTVVAGKLLSGYTAHGKDGEAITGSCTYDADTTDATAAASEILTTKSAYVSGAKVTGTMPNIGAQTGAIATAAQEITINQGYHDGSGKVKIDATEQAKIIPGNILQGVTLLGVVGTVQPSSEIQIESSKTVTPTAALQTITPSTGYDAMAQVIVNAVPYVETDNAAGGLTVTIL